MLVEALQKREGVVESSFTTEMWYLVYQAILCYRPGRFSMIEKQESGPLFISQKRAEEFLNTTKGGYVLPRLITGINQDQKLNLAGNSGLQFEEGLRQINFGLEKLLAFFAVDEGLVDSRFLPASILRILSTPVTSRKK